MARTMGMSPHTLRRRLHEEGTSFSEVASDVRKGLALDYVETSDLGLDEIGAPLAHDDPANFDRAFRHWLGESRGRCRARLAR